MENESHNDRLQNDNILNDRQAHIVVVNNILIYSKTSKTKIWSEF